MVNLTAASQYILDRLGRELPDYLHYHSQAHTLNVHRVCRDFISMQKVINSEAVLVETGALYHDCGFLIQYDHHEAAGCQIVREKLPEFGYSRIEIEKICAMIMSTRIPQTPHTFLEKLICDADLDYLGRDDFYEIGNHLFNELKAVGRIKTTEEWNQLQIRFLEAHRFFTPYSRETREPNKQIRIKELKSGLGNTSY